MSKQNIYQENGFKNRHDYLKSLAENNGLEISTVLMLAELLGPDEDFEGLVVSVEDARNEEF